MGADVRAQSASYDEEYDGVIYNNIQINGVSMTGYKKDILSKIGKPQRITKMVSDANDDHWFEYHYDRTILRVEGKRNAHS